VNSEALFVRVIFSEAHVSSYR